MNIDREVRWGARALQVLDRVRSGQLNDRQKERLPLEQVEAKLSWLDKYRDSSRLPSSSEVLESLFGKGKRLLSGSNSGTTNSLTGQLLAMVACTAAITPTLVRAAMASCSIADLRKWFKANFGQGIHYTRRLDLTPTP